MPQPLDLVSDPVPSAAVDWLQCTYVLHTNDVLDELYGFVYWLGEEVLPGSDWSFPAPGKHFTHVLRHPSGISFSYTPLQSAAGDSSGKRNEGFASIELSGRMFASVTAQYRQGLYVVMAGLRGFKRCNRLDSQITILDPPVTALDVVLLVEQGKLWPVGYGRGQAYCERAQGGQIVGAATQYFGSRQSLGRARVYDKAAEAGWSVPAVRFERQERGTIADQHFRRLVKVCEADAINGPLLVTAEEGIVRNIVGTEIDFRDTSAWANRDRPKNWAQHAPVPGWWKDYLAQPVSKIAVEFRKPVDLEATRAASLDQYGRKLAIEVFRRSHRDGTEPGEEWIRYGMDCCARLRREDLATVLALLPEEQHEKAREDFFRLLGLAEEWLEETVVIGANTPRG